MGRDPNRRDPPEPIRLVAVELVRVGLWIMWPWVCFPHPACRLVDRLRREPG